MEIDVNYEKYAPGIALAADVHIEPCPLCGKSCHAQWDRKGATYVHHAKVVKTTQRANPSLVLTRFCSETHDQIKAREEGAANGRR